MGRDVISAKLDIIFKKMFSLEENEDLLHDFLASLLEIPYNSIQRIDVLNSDVLPSTPMCCPKRQRANSAAWT